MTSVPAGAGGRVLILAAFAAAFAAPGCALRRPVAPDYGIPACPSAVGALLSSGALQCWFTAPNGRWRTLGHQSHLEALVVEVEAADLRDAETIARRFVTDQGTTFAEILVYVQTAARGGERHVRRVRWTREGGVDTLDFTSPLGEPPLTVRSLPQG